MSGGPIAISGRGRGGGRERGGGADTNCDRSKSNNTTEEESSSASTESDDVEDDDEDLHEDLFSNMALADEDTDTADTDTDTDAEEDLFGSDAKVTSVEEEKIQNNKDFAKRYLKGGLKNKNKKGCCKADDQKEHADGTSSCACPSHNHNHEHDPNCPHHDHDHHHDDNSDWPAISVLVLGDSGVGKTSFLNRHMTGQATKVHDPTTQVGVAQLLFATNYGYIKFHYIDTIGGGSGGSGSGTGTAADDVTLGGLEESYYHAVQCVMIMFDVTNPTSYENATTKWLRQANTILNPTLPKLLVGNKCDLESERKIHRSDITFHKEKKNQMYFDLSVARLTNVEIPFLSMLLTVTGIQDIEFVQVVPEEENGSVPVLPEAPKTPLGLMT